MIGLNDGLFSMKKLTKSSKQLINFKYSISKNKILLKILYFPSLGVDL